MADLSVLNWTPAWIYTEFQALHAEHQLIMDKLDEIKRGDTVSDGLEEQIRISAGLAQQIDETVPDEGPKDRRKTK